MEAEQFKLTFIPLSGKLFRFANRFLENEAEAEDVVQDVLVKLWKMREKMNEIKNREALAMTMVRNLSLDRIRARRTVTGREDTLERNTGQAEGPDVKLERSQSVKLVREIMDRLPENQKSVMHLRDIEGYEFTEIEKITGININNIRVLLSRARKQVREELLKQYQHGKESTPRSVREIL